MPAGPRDDPPVPREVRGWWKDLVEWSDYLVQDVYRRFLKPDADEPHYVAVSRACIVLMAVLAGVAAAYVTSIAAVWRFLA